MPGVLVFIFFGLLGGLFIALLLLLAGLLPGAAENLAPQQKLIGVVVLMLLFGAIIYAVAHMASLAPRGPAQLAVVGLVAGAVMSFLFLPLDTDATAGVQRVQVQTRTALPLVALPISGESTPIVKQLQGLAAGFPDNSFLGMSSSGDAASQDFADTGTPVLFTWQPARQSAEIFTPTPSPTWQALYSAVAPLPTLWPLNPPTPTLRPGGFRPPATATKPPPPPPPPPPPTATKPPPTATRTNTRVPTRTNTPVPPTATNTPPPTATNTPVPTATNTQPPPPTDTPPPTVTNTPEPPTVDTPGPDGTNSVLPSDPNATP